VVFLHGGPGGGAPPSDRCYFNPEKYRIVLLDQRGCGRSKPSAADGGLVENTTWHLVADLEALRTHLAIDKWVVFGKTKFNKKGGSWGSTLSLVYAIKHPDRVKALILRGIFTLRREELQFFYQSGASFIFPDEFEPYRDAIPESERGDLISAYYKRITAAESTEERLKFARLWVSDVS
jgi:proline iminopeptidase